MKIQFHKLSRLKALPAMLCLLASINAAADSPVANSGAVVTSGNARFTVLTPQMIRIEYSDKCAFEDRATFAIQNRQLDVPSFATNDDGEYLYITTEKVTLKYRKGTNPKTLPASGDNLTITISHNGHNEVWYPGKPDPLNLKGTSRTLDGADGDNLRSELENGLISRSGWSVIDDSWTAARPDGSRSFALAKNDVLGYDWWIDRNDPKALDLYFLGYGSDYKTALYDFTRVAGKIPLPPSYVFGYWYSRYASYEPPRIYEALSYPHRCDDPRYGLALGRQVREPVIRHRRLDRLVVEHQPYPQPQRPAHRHSQQRPQSVAQSAPRRWHQQPRVAYIL